MESARTLSAKLKLANETIAKLEEKVKEEKEKKEHYDRKCDELQKELNSIHGALDAVGVPKEIKDGCYSKKELCVPARMFVWISEKAFGKPKEVEKVIDNE